jgi:hypothetical protein
MCFEKCCSRREAAAFRPQASPWSRMFEPSVDARTMRSATVEALPLGSELDVHVGFLRRVLLMLMRARRQKHSGRMSARHSRKREMCGNISPFLPLDSNG